MSQQTFELRKACMRITRILITKLNIKTIKIKLQIDIIVYLSNKQYLSL